MIVPMTKYSFVLLSGEKEQFLADLQELGVVDIKRSDKAVDAESAAMFGKIDAIRAEVACIEKGKDDHVAELESKREGLLRERADIAPWGVYDKSMLDNFEIHFYKVPSKKFDQTWGSEYALQVIDESAGTTCFVIAGSNEGFPLSELPRPSGDLKALDIEIAALDSEIASAKAAIEARRPEIPALQAEADKISRDLVRYLAGAAGESAAEDKLVVFEGFAPTEISGTVCNALDNTGVLYIKEDAKGEDKPPIELKNNKFVKMFEVLTDMYGRPDYNSFDPTPFISIFFLLFFALCLGDAGYGIVLAILGLGLKKVKSFADLSPLVTTLGIATIFVGIVIHTFFGINLYEAAWVPAFLKKFMIVGDIAGFDAQMLMSLVIGVVHISIAMIVKTFVSTRNKGFMGSLATWGWTILIVGGVAVAALALLNVIDASLTKWIVIALGVVSALGIFILNTPGRNPLINIGAGLWDTYGMVTGLLGDVLSYLRLYALGLAGGMLGNAFNELAGMTLGIEVPGLGWICFALIALIGHVLNIAMCVLGAFVHPLRLNFLEFFKNSEYDGSGRNYDPIK